MKPVKTVKAALQFDMYDRNRVFMTLSVKMTDNRKPRIQC